MGYTNVHYFKYCSLVSAGFTQTPLYAGFTTTDHNLLELCWLGCLLDGHDLTI